jgi:hypothetical protein
MSVKRYKFFRYQNPKTKQVFSEMREFSDKDRDYIDKDGTVCPRVLSAGENNSINIGIWRKDREVFEADPDYVKGCNPKYVRFQDGHRERYDPTKHN